MSVGGAREKSLPERDKKMSIEYLRVYTVRLLPRASAVIDMMLGEGGAR